MKKDSLQLVDKTSNFVAKGPRIDAQQPFRPEQLEMLKRGPKSIAYVVMARSTKLFLFKC